MRITELLKHQQTTALDVEDELQFHLEMLERNYAQHGMSAAEAKTAALRRFGDLEKVKKQCVAISKRNSALRRVFKTSLLLLALFGIAIRILSTDLNVDHIGTTLIIIAISGRLLIHAHGLKSSTLLPKTKETSLSIIREP